MPPTSARDRTERRRRHLPAAGAFTIAVLPLQVVLGCSSPDTQSTAAERPSAIVNGEADPGHPAAVAVVLLFPKSNGKIGAVSCTGTIFDVHGDSGTVLTAAHCLLPNAAAGVPQ